MDDASRELVAGKPIYDDFAESCGETGPGFLHERVALIAMGKFTGLCFDFPLFC
jgi:hypothetical protein